MQLTTDALRRPADLSNRDDAGVMFHRSYLLTRVIVGLMGILLPLILWALEASPLLKAGWRARGSLSAYYHSGARDIFVAVLCITGFFLITYMAGQRGLLECWLSTVAGVAALGVALLPTTRPGLGADPVYCGASASALPGCTPIQHALGERVVAGVHFASAGIFILTLAAICFVFAYREQRYKGSTAHARFDRGCGVAILVAVAWVAVGTALDRDLLGLTPLYVGEVVSVLAFGACWIHKARDLLLSGPRGNGPPPPTTGNGDVV